MSSYKNDAQNSLKCDTCNKLLKMVEQLVNKCQCSKIFCTKHKQTHVCTYDYYNDNKKILEEKHKKVVKDKITKI